MPAVRFPKLGYATADGTVLSWLKAVGDPVQRGDELVEVLSEKAISVVAAGADGVLSAIYAEPGAIVPEEAPIAWIGKAGETPPDLRPQLVGWNAEVAPAPADLAERLAAEPGPAADAEADFPLELRGPGKPDRRTRELLKGELRAFTAERLARSWRAPKVDLFADIDFSRVVAHRQALKDGGGEAPSFNVYIAHAAARAMQRFPELNGQWIGGRFVPLEGVHIGVAVALDASLVTVSMKDLAGVSLGDVQARFKGLIRKAATMSLAREELYGSSLTVTNLGEFEISGFTAVLNPPEVFILAIGRLEDRVVPREGKPAIVPYSTFCLSFDHRAVDGAPASRLLREIKHQLERYDEG